MSRKQIMERASDHAISLFKGRTITVAKIEKLVNLLIELLEHTTGHTVKNKPFKIEIEK